jgi:hypothetical protein
VGGGRGGGRSGGERVAFVLGGIEGGVGAGGGKRCGGAIRALWVRANILTGTRKVSEIPPFIRDAHV